MRKNEVIMKSWDDRSRQQYNNAMKRTGEISLCEYRVYLPPLISAVNNRKIKIFISLKI